MMPGNKSIILKKNLRAYKKPLHITSPLYMVSPVLKVSDESVSLGRSLIILIKLQYSEV